MEGLRANISIIWGLKSGIKAYNKGNDEKALNYYFQALKISRRLNIKPFMAASYYNIALIYDSWGDFDNSIYYYHNAIKTWKEIGFEAGIKKATRKVEGLGELSAGLVEPKDYIRIKPEEQKEGEVEPKEKVKKQKLEKVKGEYKEIDRESLEGKKEKTQLEKISEGNELLSLAEEQHIDGRHKTAVILYKKALEIFEYLNNHRLISITLRKIGAVNRSLGNYSEALDAYEKSLDILEYLDDNKGKGLVYNNIGNIYLIMGDDEKALQHFQKALKIYRRINYERGVEIILRNIKRIQGKKEIEKEQEKKLETKKRSVYRVPKTIISEEKKEEAEKYRKLGRSYQVKGNFSKAMEYYYKAYEIFNKKDDKKTMSEILVNIGALFRSWEKYDEAIEYYTHSLRIKESLDDIKGKAKVLTLMGFVYQSWKKYDKALTSFNKSLEIFESLNDSRGINWVMNNIEKVLSLL
ncbi:MAG: tetratricopeptide repeat protein [Promethearchaeota archaeon]|nr:MAG: tetratricopeptide repeat protein [Candidatus Lokiarchaeota archaeon]